MEGVESSFGKSFEIDGPAFYYTGRACSLRELGAFGPYGWPSATWYNPSQSPHPHKSPHLARMTPFYLLTRPE